MPKKLSHEEAMRIMLNANLKPLENYEGAEKPWRCVCTACGREVSPRLRSVRDRGSGCKYCSGNAVVPEEAVAEMLSIGLTPIISFPGASKPWLSKCNKCKSEVKPRLADIRMGHSGCKKCADELGGKKRRLNSNPVRAGVTTNFSEVLEVMRSADLEPLEEYEGSQKKWKSKCLKCGAIVSPRYTTIAQGGGGCMDCFREEQIGRGRLDEESASMVMRAKNLEPLETYPGAMKPWTCKCLDCGNIIKPRYAHIQQGRKGCSFCGTKSNRDKMRLPQEEAFAVARSNGFEPLEPYRGRHFAWKCRCLKCGKTIAPHYAGIVTGGGCRFCSGLVVDPAIALLVMKKAGLTPLVVYPGAGKPWLCQCVECKRQVTPRYSSVNNGIGGCKYCATHGYDFSKGGVLYLITSPELKAHKIGITNEGAKEKRIAKHIKEGWRVYRTRYFTDGNVAFEVEQEILLWWRVELAMPVYLSKFEMPQGGFTETVDGSEVDLMTIWNKVEDATKKMLSSGVKTTSRKTSMPIKTKRI